MDNKADRDGSENKSVTEYKRQQNTKHTKMPARQRAKQFMPFAAVTGLDAALREKELEIQLQYEEKKRPDK